jgi:hypothetical protein
MMMYVIHNILTEKFVANADSPSADSYTNLMAYIKTFATLPEAESALCPMNEEIVNVLSLTVTKDYDHKKGGVGADFKDIENM